MKSVFEQPWLYALIAFVLGVVIGYLARGRRTARTDTGPKHAMSTQSEKDTTSRPVASLLSPAASQAAAEAAAKSETAEPEPAAKPDVVDAPDAAPDATPEPAEAAEPSDPALSQMDHESLTSALHEPTTPATDSELGGTTPEPAAAGGTAATAEAEPAEPAGSGSDTESAGAAPAASAEPSSVAAEPVAKAEPAADTTTAEPAANAESASDTGITEPTTTSRADVAADTELAATGAEPAAGTRSAEVAKPAANGVSGDKVTPVAAEAGAERAPGDSWAPGPYPASALPAEGGEAPAEEFTIKAKADSKLFHTEKSPYYRRVKPDVWFRNEADAVAAGFTGWARRAKAK